MVVVQRNKRRRRESWTISQELPANFSPYAGVPLNLGEWRVKNEPLVAASTYYNVVPSARDDDGGGGG